MGFEERLNETLDRVLSEKGRFNSEWGEKRRNVVEPLLRLAETQLRMKLRGARLQPANGTITLYAGYLGSDNYLRFSPDEDRLEVHCSLSTYPKDSDEPAAPDETTPLAIAEISEAAIEKTIIDFAAMVARGGRRLKL